jgi:phosphoadenosine phosphosulfate reductase
MNPEQIALLNAELAELPAAELVSRASQLGNSIVTTNFRPYEAVILHLATASCPEMPVLWIDHGCNLPETYLFAERCRDRLSLNLKPYLPKKTAAHWLATHGGLVPMPDEIEKVESFSRIMKLEPFERGMRELAPAVWITALRKEQNPQRAASLKTVAWDAKFNCLKVNPLLNWTESDLDAYILENDLPNEKTYYDPAKGDEKHECGIHAKLMTDRA